MSGYLPGRHQAQQDRDRVGHARIASAPATDGALMLAEGARETGLGEPKPIERGTELRGGHLLLSLPGLRVSDALESHEPALNFDDLCRPRRCSFGFCEGFDLEECLAHVPSPVVDDENIGQIAMGVNMPWVMILDVAMGEKR